MDISVRRVDVVGRILPTPRFIIDGELPEMKDLASVCQLYAEMAASWMEPESVSRVALCRRIIEAAR